MARQEKTSKKVGTAAARLLRTSSNQDVKKVAASALTQRPNRKDPKK